MNYSLILVDVCIRRVMFVPVSLYLDAALFTMSIMFFFFFVARFFFLHFYIYIYIYFFFFSSSCSSIGIRLHSLVSGNFLRAAKQFIYLIRHFSYERYSRERHGKIRPKNTICFETFLLVPTM